MFSLCVLKLVHRALKTIAKNVVKMRVSDCVFRGLLIKSVDLGGGDHPYIYIYIYIYICRYIYLTPNPERFYKKYPVARSEKNTRFRACSSNAFEFRAPVESI